MTDPPSDRAQHAKSPGAPPSTYNADELKMCCSGDAPSIDKDIQRIRMLAKFFKDFSKLRSVLHVSFIANFVLPPNETHLYSGTG